MYNVTEQWEKAPKKNRVWVQMQEKCQAHVEEEGLETEVETGARVVPVEQEDCEQTPQLPHEPCVRILWAPGPERVL